MSKEKHYQVATPFAAERAAFRLIRTGKYKLLELLRIEGDKVVLLDQYEPGD